MRPLRPILCFVIAAATLPFLIHCGSARPESGGVPTVAASDAGPAEPASLADAGFVTDLSIVEEADSPCVKSTAESETIYDRDRTPIGYANLGRIGDRLFARGTNDEGFVLFDQNGDNASHHPFSFHLQAEFVPQNDGLVGVSFDDSAEGRVVAQRFTSNGTAHGAAATLGTGHAYSIAVGSANDAVIGVWSTGSAVNARAIDATWATSPTMTLESDSPHDGFHASVVGSVAGDGSDFLVLWSLRRAALAEWRVYAQLTNHNGPVGLPRKLFGATHPVALIKGVTVADGYAALFDFDGAPLVVGLDKLGRLASSAHRFSGAKNRFGSAFGIASHEGQLAITAVRTDASDAFRRLDRAGTALGPWVCLSDPDTSITHQSSIDCGDDGCSILYTGEGGSVRFARTDGAGMAR